MSKLRFDPIKPFATVVPPYNGAVHSQTAVDGKLYYFNANDEPIDIETGEVTSVNVKAPKEEDRVTTITVVGADGTKTIEEVPDTSELPKNPREELLKWITGADGAESNWMKIRSYGKVVYGRVAPSKEELVTLMIESGDVKADQVKA